MISLTLLQEKKIKDFFDDSEYTGNNLYPKLDLTSNRWEIDYDSIVIDANIEVDTVIEMRLDKLARHILGSEDFVDVIVKFNRILDVFAVKKGDVIRVPNLASFFTNVRKANYKSKNIKRDVLINKKGSSGGNNSIATKVVGKDLKTYKKGKNGVIIF
ncbi:hypothetical protein BPT24_174 [Tenacibaculum phage pT24]|uniref:Uncharacterized protein n=1 Tax=Tenacibaculum phage pT24 TaxID=1880590 RepID=A0A1B4XWV9_9CAUD|nr:baseplate wedge subunit [Tenacibaculum phage pT24]BAV39300.1 hypothetical protein BPT24_174 [Tenacibaculum phage pT24]